MRYSLINDAAQRTFAVILDTGDEAIDSLTRFARDQGLSASQFTAIGAFRRVVLGYFDFARKDYKRIPLDEQVEVVSLLGDITTKDGDVAIHAHVVVADSNGNARGGHLLEARVRPTLEVIVTESPAHLRRQVDAETGLPLIRI